MKFAKEPGFADIGMDLPGGEPEPSNTTVATGYLDGRTGDFGDEAQGPVTLPGSDPATWSPTTGQTDPNVSPGTLEISIPVPSSASVKKGILVAGVLAVVSFFSLYFFGGSGYRSRGY